MFLKFIKNARSIVAVFCFLAVTSLSVAAAPSLFEELEERTGGSALEVLSILAESLEYGVTSVEFNETDFRGDQNRLLLNFYANAYEFDYGLEFELLDRWDDINFAAFLNTERFAVRTPSFGESFFGVRFDTLTDDLQALLGDEDSFDIDEVLGYLDSFISYLNAFDPNVLNIGDFADLLLQAALMADITNEETTLNSAPANLQQISIDLHDVLDLLTIVVERVADIYDDPMFDDIFNYLSEDWLREIEWMREDYVGTIVISIYTNNDGRLLRAAVAFDFIDTFRGEAEPVMLFIDFGTSAMDTWTFGFESTDRWGEEAVTITWEISEYQNSRQDIFSFTSTTMNSWREEPWVDTGSLGVRWNNSTGELTLFMEDNDFYDEVSGILEINRRSFTLSFAEYDFKFVISATVGTPVPSIEFINIDEWGPMLLGLFEPIDFELIDFEFYTEPPSTITANTAVVVGAQYVYLRRGPGVSHTAFNHLTIGDVVIVLETQGNWTRVESDRGIGWVFSRYLETV